MGARGLKHYRSCQFCSHSIKVAFHLIIDSFATFMCRLQLIGVHWIYFWHNLMLFELQRLPPIHYRNVFWIALECPCFSRDRPINCASVDCQQINKHLQMGEEVCSHMRQIHDFMPLQWSTTTSWVKLTFIESADNDNTIFVSISQASTMSKCKIPLRHLCCHFNILTNTFFFLLSCTTFICIFSSTFLPTDSNMPEIYICIAHFL